MKSEENVKKYQYDICEALGVEHKEEDMLHPYYFLGRFEPHQIDYLEKKSLINRGFCPDCGKSPIDSSFYRSKTGDSKIKEYLCEECWDAAKPSVRHKHEWLLSFKKVIFSAVGIGIFMGLLCALFIWLIRSCV